LVGTATIYGGGGGFVHWVLLFFVAHGDLNSGSLVTPSVDIVLLLKMLFFTTFGLVLFGFENLRRCRRGGMF